MGNSLNLGRGWVGRRSILHCLLLAEESLTLQSDRLDKHTPALLTLVTDYQLSMLKGLEHGGVAYFQC